MIQYLNYSAIDTSGITYATPVAGGLGGFRIASNPCDTTTPCLIFPGGTSLRYKTGNTFEGTDDSNNVLIFAIDMDGPQEKVGFGTVFVHAGGAVTYDSAIGTTRLSGFDNRVGVIADVVSGNQPTFLSTTDD